MATDRAGKDRLSGIFEGTTPHRGEASEKPVRFDQLNPQDQLNAFIVILLALAGTKIPENQPEEKPAPDTPDSPAGPPDELAEILGFEDQASYDTWREGIVQDAQTHSISLHAAARDAAQNFDYTRFDSTLNGRAVLDLIAEHESGGDYNIAYGGRHVDFTSMSIDEVLAWQKEYVADGSPSSAAGRYQFIHKTLNGLKEELGLRGDELFDEAMQDRLATVLLERRGYDRYLSGELSEEQLMRNLSMEWASLPKDWGGASYYAGDGLNKALTSPEDVLAAMRADKTAQDDGKIGEASARSREEFAASANPGEETVPAPGGPASTPTLSS